MFRLPAAPHLRQHTCHGRTLTAAPRARTGAARAAARRAAATPVQAVHRRASEHAQSRGGLPADIAAAVRGAAAAAAHTLGALGVAAALLLGSPTPALSDEQTVLRFPASSDPSIFAAQQTLVNAWTIIREAYYDGSFGGSDWERELSAALVAAYESPDEQTAYGVIAAMLESLGDPYTRIVPPTDYNNFRLSAEGEVQGVGLLIAQDPDSGKLVVLAPVRGGPADRAGIRSGDVVESIDGIDTDGWDGERAASVLRGRSGSSVSVRFARRTDQVPGVPGRPEAPLPTLETKQVVLRREKVELSPVVYAAVPVAGRTFGYIQLTSFSQHAGVDMRAAIQTLTAEGADAFILDLRNNPGGLVRAALDVAQLWLGGHAPVFNVTGRTDGAASVQQVVLEQGGPALTSAPLAVLINEGSASASEILAGALHDNGRATLLGDANSYGKGKIQSVYELPDGSGLFVTVAKYLTPQMHEIDRVGIHPDASCGVTPPDALLGRGGGRGGAEAPRPAGRPLPSIALSQGELAAAVQQDSCVISAESLLEKAQPAARAMAVAPPLRD